ncbi:hypothetical protein HaLaN_04909 [Haematococcus lacustris]|uniref:Uncharacterized protein n=1 Tax=Haematococcus lacustris TaxID=44745 RepID=A0A699YHQ8_HAELA|nr:hypothetical protein HaLaN_04909 [Haematococcus lacustris]
MLQMQVSGGGAACLYTAQLK